MNIDEGKKNSKIGIFIILGSFIFVVMINIFYIFIAKKTWRGIVEENAYQTGLHYNEVLAQEKRQKALKIKVISSYKQDLGELSLEVFDAQKNKISDAKIEVKFVRMLQSELDFTTYPTFQNGFYISQIKLPAYGKWRVQISIFFKNGEIFQTHEEFFVRKLGS